MNQRSAPRKNSFHVAIIGAGVTGLSLAIALKARKVSFTLYERCSSYREIGAGFAISPNAEHAMSLLDAGIREVFEEVAQPNLEDYFPWINGLTDEPIFKIYMGVQSFRACRRSDLLISMAKLIPNENFMFNMEVVRVIEQNRSNVEIEFKGGHKETANVGKLGWLYQVYSGVYLQAAL